MTVSVDVEDAFDADACELGVNALDDGGVRFAGELSVLCYDYIKPEDEEGASCRLRAKGRRRGGLGRRRSAGDGGPRVSVPPGVQVSAPCGRPGGLSGAEEAPSLRDVVVDIDARAESAARALQRLLRMPEHQRLEFLSGAEPQVRDFFFQLAGVI